MPETWERINFNGKKEINLSWIKLYFYGISFDTDTEKVMIGFL